MRLPGIESFDSMRRSTTPVHRQPSPMMVDTPSRHGGEPYSEERRNSQHWEMGAPRSYPDRVEFGRGPPAFDSAGAWASEANLAVQARAEQAHVQPSQVRFEQTSYPDRTHPSTYHHQSAPVVTPREAKRQAWYQGPVSAHPPQPVVDPQLQQTSPANSSGSDNVPGTPSNASVRDSNPGIVHANGYVESRDYPMNDARPGPGGYTHYPPPHGPEAAYTYGHGQQAPQADPQHHEPKSPDNSMLRLEALVAVATSEENVAATAY
jgi:hypothetical protein